MLVQVGREKRTKGLMRGRKNGWEERKPAAIRGVAAAVDGIRRGRFSPTPYADGSCAHCAAKGVCRYEPARIERKQEATRDTDA
jgi:hypothetical protein